MRVKFMTVATVALALVVAGCGKDNSSGPLEGAKSDSSNAATELGFPTFATKNTTRVGGGDATANAAATALATYPGGSKAGHPAVVALAPNSDWRTALAATQLEGSPLDAALLLSGGELPAATSGALDSLQPKGAAKLNGAQIIKIGNVAVPKGMKIAAVTGSSPADTAVAIAKLKQRATKRPKGDLLVVSMDTPEFSMPAAAWSARSGDPILFVSKNEIPAATAAMIKARKNSHVFLLGPTEAISAKTQKAITKLGARVTRIQGNDPTSNAIAFARFSDGVFGWGIVDPGHGLVFARSNDPLEAVAAAALSTSGTFGPLLLLSSSEGPDKPLREYLLDIQPGYRDDPVRGVYNHGWIIGNTKDISTRTQARIDSLLEIAPITTNLP